MKNHNMKLAIKATMKARAMGIIWKLILQIIMDKPSAIVNAWQKLGATPEEIDHLCDIAMEGDRAIGDACLCLE